MKVQKPTTQERHALKRIEATNWLSVIVVAALAGLLPAAQFLPERFSSVSAVLSILMVLGAIGVLVYRTCFLRCPRCSGWVAMPKCVACGLTLEKFADGGSPGSR